MGAGTECVGGNSDFTYAGQHREGALSATKLPVETSLKASQHLQDSWSQCTGDPADTWTC